MPPSFPPARRTVLRVFLFAVLFCIVAAVCVGSAASVDPVMPPGLDIPTEPDIPTGPGSMDGNFVTKYSETQSPVVCTHATHPSIVTGQEVQSVSEMPESGSGTLNLILGADIVFGKGATWTVPVGTTTNICLNGYQIYGKSDSGQTDQVTHPVIIVPSGATLNIYYDAEENTGTGKISGDRNQGILVRADGACNFYGGTITGITPVTDLGSAHAAENVFTVVSVSGQFTLAGGTIKDNGAGGSSIYRGYAVEIENGGIFTMESGSITGTKTATANDNLGGAVYVNGGTFSMKGGSITGNTGSGSVNYHGVYLSSGTLTLSGSPVIADNSNEGGDSNLYIESGTVTINDALENGAEIGISMATPDDFTSNTPIANQQYFFSDSSSYAVGASEPDTSGKSSLSLGSPTSAITWELNDGTITPTPANKAVTNSYIALPTPTKESATFKGWSTNGGSDIISGDYLQITGDTALTAVWEAAAHVCPGHDTNGDGTPDDFMAWDRTDSLPTEGNYYLTEDVELSNEQIIQQKKTVNLCLNGHVVKKKDGAGTFSLITVYGTLNLYDCLYGNTNSAKYFNEVDEDTHGGTIWVYDSTLTSGENVAYGGVITGGGKTGFEGYGGVSVGYDGTFTMFGGTIVGNVGNNGGGVYVEMKGTFTMNDGTITGNNGNYGGGVYVEKTGKFTMSNGKISGNYGGTGGGVNINREGASFTMSGGTISGNTGYGVSVASGSSSSGGGLFSMSGGTISGNSKEGVYLRDSTSIFIIPGGGSEPIVITDNNKGVSPTKNVYLPSKVTITFENTEPLLDGSSIGITMAAKTGTFATSTVEANKNFFTPDTSSYSIAATLNSQGSYDLALGNPCTITWNSNGGTPETVEQTIAIQGTSILAPTLTHSNSEMILLGWEITPAGGEVTMVSPSATITVPSASSATIKAIWGTERFTVTIPSGSLPIPDSGASLEQSVTVDSTTFTLPANKYLQVTVSSANAWILKDNGVDGATYKMTYSGGGVGSGTCDNAQYSTANEQITIMKAVPGAANTATHTTDLSFSLIGAKYSGTFTDTLTFSVSVVDTTAAAAV